MELKRRRAGVEAVRLGWRLAASRSQVPALLVVAAAAALTSLIFAAALAAPAVISAQHEAANRSALVSDRSTGVYVSESSLDWKDQFSIRRRLISGDGRRAVPPGLPHVPGLGEVWVSPALNRALSDDPTLAGILSAPPTGTIAPSGLVSPHQMLMYVGVGREKLAGPPGTQGVRFGGEVDHVVVDGTLKWLAIANVILLVGIPALVVLVAALAQLATRRVDRYRILDGLGVPARAARVALGLDGVLACLVGALVGLAAFAGLARQLRALPGVPASWWAEQVSLSPLLCLLVVAVPVVAGLSSQMLIGDPPEAVGPDASGARRRGSYRLLPVVVGSALAGSTIGTRVDGSPLALAVVVTAVVLLAAGVPLAVPVLAAAGGRRLLRNGSGARLIAGGRLVRGRPAARRAGTIMATTVILATAASPLVAQAAPRNLQAAATNRELGRVLVFISGLSPHTTLDALATVPGVIEVTALDKRRGGPVVSLPCAAVHRLTGAAATGRCQAGRRARLSRLSPASMSAIGASLGDPWIKVGEAVRVLPTPRPGQQSGAQAIALVDDEPSYWRLAAAVARAPFLGETYATVGGLLGGVDQPYAKVQQWLMVGLTGLLFTAAVSLMMGIAEDNRSRRRTVSALLAIGVAASTIRRSHRIEILVRLGATSALSLAVAGVLTVAATSWVGADSVSAGWFGLLCLAVASTAGLGLLLGPVGLLPRQPLIELRAE